MLREPPNPTSETQRPSPLVGGDGHPLQAGSRLSVLRAAGPSGVAAMLATRLWSTHRGLGLAADLADVPVPRPASVDVLMEPCDPLGFSGFADDVPLLPPADAVDVARRHRMCAAGVAGLHVAFDPDRRPIYAQWLVVGSQGRGLRRFSNDLLPEPADGEALVEGAYTFVAFRRRGAMADGMHQLLRLAADAGASRCLTYVAPENRPSLRGCAAVGFALDHVRLDRRRLGRRTVTQQAPSPDDEAGWRAAVAPAAG